MAGMEVGEPSEMKQVLAMLMELKQEHKQDMQSLSMQMTALTAQSAGLSSQTQDLAAKTQVLTEKTEHVGAGG